MYEVLVAVVAAFAPHMNSVSLAALLLLRVASGLPGWWMQFLLAVEATLDLRDRRYAGRSSTSGRPSDRL